jgi:hypothetical protein
VTEQVKCKASREYPYLFDWTDEADEWHDEGEVRPTFGIVRDTCLRVSGHAGDHEWPPLVIPAPRRQLKAEYMEPAPGREPGDTTSRLGPVGR